MVPSSKTWRWKGKLVLLLKLKKKKKQENGQHNHSISKKLQNNKKFLSNEAGEGSVAQFSWGRDVYPVKDNKGRGRPYHSLQLKPSSNVGIGVFFWVTCDRKWGNGLKLHQGYQALEWVVQESSWVTIPRGTEKLYRYGTEGRGLREDLALLG